MYSLIVTARNGAWNETSFALEESRFLEHTEEAIRNRYQSLSPSVLEELARLPAIFAYETGVHEPARVGRITEMRRRQGELRFSFEFDPSVDPITTETLAEHSWDFDINRYEMNRTHWAIKDVDLDRALQDSEIVQRSAIGPQDAQLSRRTVIGAIDILAGLSHSNFDRMILEFGIAGLSAGREVGSRMARSNALAEFALSNPSVLTAEGESIGHALVRRAAEFASPRLDDVGTEYEDLGIATFRDALEADGYHVIDGRLSRISSIDSDHLTPESAGTGTVEQERVVPPPSTDERYSSSLSALVNRSAHFQIPDGGVQSDLVSVMMPFEAAFDPIHAAIKSACSEAGMQCKRVDDMWEDSTVIQDVFSLIYRSRVVIVDFSGKNPNVFYETGIAHTLGKPVVPITQSEADVPFDLRHHRHLRYLSNGEGLRDLTSKLASRLRTLIGR